MRPSSRTLGLASLALAALALRLFAIWALAAESDRPVTYEHGEIAEHLLAGHGFTVTFLGVCGPTSQQAPFYPALLATAYRLFGIGTPEARLAIQVLQALAGTALVLSVVWLGWSLVPQRPALGWIAGWGAAVYPTHIYMVTHLQVAIWAALVLTLLVAVAASPRGRSSWRRGALAGLLAGLLVLIEPILAIALPFVAATLATGFAEAARRLRHGRRWRHDGAPWEPWSQIATMAAVASLVVAPWIWRNCRVHGEFVFVKSTFGYAFWQGNNPASWGTDKIPKSSAETLRNEHDGTLAGMNRALWEARHETLYIDDVLLAPHGYGEFAGLSEPARSRLLGSRAWQFVCDEPARYAQLCVQRLRYFLLFDATNPKASNMVYRAATVAWLALTCVGSLSLAPQWRRIWPAWAIFAAVTAFHSLTIVSARFRIPIEPLSFVWAAGGGGAGISGSWEAARATPWGTTLCRSPLDSPQCLRCKAGQLAQGLVNLMKTC